MLRISVTSWHGRGVWTRMTECQPTEIRPFPLHMYRAYAPTPTPLQPRHSGTGIKLSESDNQGRHLCPEIHRRMDNRNEATALRVPLADFEHNNCVKLWPETNTSLRPQLNVLRGTNIHAKMFNIESLLRDIIDWNSVQICLKFYCLIENRFFYINCKEHSIDRTSTLIFVLSIL